MTVQGNIEGAKAHLSSAEMRVATYILAHPDDVISMSVHALAEAAETSPATISRLARSLNFPGYRELKLQLSSDHSRALAAQTDDQIYPNEPIDSIKFKLLTNAKNSLEETVDQMQEAPLQDAVAALKNASQVVCFGVGASYLAALDISQKWARLGIPTLASSDVHELLPLTSGEMATKKVFWVVSNSGETPEAVLVASLAKENGATVITMSRVGQNSLTKAGSIALQTSQPREGAIRFAATQSLHAQFMMVDIVYYSYVSQNYEQASRLVRDSREQLDDYKQQLHHVLKKND
ncbi:MurR/RpiR family transcriptional regulator [Lacticaseibacillus mingshuiensis]|uniref:MurR/RpiR family transcriptional regulator n=1 Tax=Lacticaseibacillus mingshuiensis TaxID=2799574 RepID=A0ABW4CFP9_9LACO|nr:MurR/RpiR family transcriptional regulator [Lacticaseibacillus mingshuiensis]